VGQAVTVTSLSWRRSYVSGRTCWMLMISLPSCGVMLYQIATPFGGQPQFVGAR
jgi:hypothetical protein